MFEISEIFVVLVLDEYVGLNITALLFVVMMIVLLTVESADIIEYEAQQFRLLNDKSDLILKYVSNGKGNIN